MQESLRDLRCYIKHQNYLIEWNYNEIGERDFFFLESYFKQFKDLDKTSLASDEELESQFGLLMKIKNILLVYFKDLKYCKAQDFNFNEKGLKSLKKELKLESEATSVLEIIKTETNSIFSTYIKKEYIKEYNKIFKKDIDFLAILKSEFMFWFNLATVLLVSFKRISLNLEKKQPAS